ncbi:MAG: BspA family leucine-rich repeat surface protein, partial [Crocinitomicaceae bacterium]|nr:BspA family leucine-rich repeat surface protein [Crocinitomicaceae bacterium]
MKSIVFTLLFMVLSFAYHGQMILKYNTSLSPGTTIPLGLYGDFTEGIFLNVNVDWGDGNSDSYNFGDLYYHTYAQEGIYTVTISGDLGRMTSHSDKLIEVESFGNLGITSLNNSFINATNLVAVPNTLPSTVKNLSYCLSGANSFNQDVSSWNVENVTRFSGMFMGASNFNQPLGTWNMSSA